jgi:hypothetical protein
MINNKILKIKCTDFSYNPFDGYFFVYPKSHNVNVVETCRELFSWNCFKGNSQFIGFFHRSLTAEKMDKFFDYINKRLNLSPENQITFYNTDINGAVILELPNFWRENNTKRGILTLFMRACIYGDNFLESIQRYTLMNKIKPTIEHFLDGNTKTTYQTLKRGGVVDNFRNLSREDIKKRLIKP